MDGGANLSPIQQCRDRFLEVIFARYPSLDYDEIYEVLCLFKQPFRMLAETDTSAVGSSHKVVEPWSFDHVRVLDPSDIDMSNTPSTMMRCDGDVGTLEVTLQESMPDLNRLSLENKEKQDQGGRPGFSRSH